MMWVTWGTSLSSLWFPPFAIVMGAPAGSGQQACRWGEQVGDMNWKLRLQGHPCHLNHLMLTCPLPAHHPAASLPLCSMCNYHGGH